MTINQLIGPPIGAFIFTLGMASPFVTQAVLMLAATGLIRSIGSISDPPSTTSAHASVRTDIREGFQWLWNHAPIRTLAIAITAFNVTFGAAWSVLVLYVIEHLEMGEIGFGLITSASAIGGVIGAISYERLEKRFSLATMMKAGLITETLTHLGLALTSTPWVALSIFFAFGIHASIWSTTAHSVRQRAVPTAFQGRVGSVYLVGVFVGILVGGIIGGLAAQAFGILAPFWFAFVGSTLILVWIWPRLDQIAHVD